MICRTLVENETLLRDGKEGDDAIRWIVSDLDGTLLDTDATPLFIPASLTEAIRDWMACGGGFAVATGRPLRTLLPIVERMGLQIPLIAGNGAVVRSEEGVVLHRATFPLEWAIPLLQRVQKKITCLLFVESGVYANRYDEWTQRYAQKEESEVVVRSWEEMQESHIEKLLLMGEPKQLFSAWEGLSENERKGLHCLGSEPHYLEVLKQGTDKGSGLRLWMEHAKISKSEVASIGNERNDMALLEASGRGFAVNNAVEPLKQIAHVVTAGSYSAGVEEMLRRYVRLRCG